MIYHPQRKTYYFAASSETQMKDWMHAISEQKSKIQGDDDEDYSSSSDEEVSCFKLMKRKKKRLLMELHDEEISMNAMKDYEFKPVIVSKRDQGTQTVSLDDTNRINCKIQCEACPHKKFTNQSAIIVNGHINLNMRIDPENIMKVRMNDQFPVRDIESCQLNIEKPNPQYSEKLVKEKLIRLCEDMSKQLNMELNVDSVSIGECTHHKITDTKNVFINNGVNHNTNIIVTNKNGYDEILINFLKNVLKIDESKV